MRSTRFSLIAASATIVVVALVVAFYWPMLNNGKISGIAKIGGPFTLVDHQGNARSDGDFRGRYLLVYFGYTYCPDVCPTALNDMSIALEELGDQASEVQPIFVTIDPERDTVGRLKEYVANFHPRMIGLTGSPSDISAIAKAYRVYFAKSQGAKDDQNYLMDHSSIVYLMGRNGEYVTHFSHGVSIDTMAQSLRKHLS